MRRQSKIGPLLCVALACVVAMAMIAAIPEVALAGQGSQCQSDGECAGDRVCVQGFCVSGEAVGPNPQRSSPQETQPQTRAQRSASPVPDDGGADAACGADRRCRIDRIAERNRLHRQYEFAQNRLIVEEEIARIEAEQRGVPPRVARPKSASYHNTPFGHGLVAGYTFQGTLRPEVVGLTYEDRVTGNVGTPGSSGISERHHFRSVGAQLTLLTMDSVITPILSLGFFMSRGELGGGGWSSDWAADVHYHFLVGAVGFDLQLESGLIARLTMGQGRLLYHQVRYGPGNYDAALRPVLREHMHSDRLRGLAISIGWAFQ